MKEHRPQDSVRTVHVLPVFFLACCLLVSLTACGIPTYVDFDDTVTWTRISQDDTSITWDFAMDADGLATIATMVDDGPGLKFFYTVSNDTNPNSYGGSLQIKTSFDSYFRKSSTIDGLEWTSGISSAPGFYLFTRKSGYSGNPLTLERPSSDLYDPVGAKTLAGTFAFDQDGTGVSYLFPEAPWMDIAVPADGEETVTLSLLADSPTPQGWIVELVIDSTTQTLKSYRNGLFPDDADDLGQQRLYESEDGEFFSYLDPYAENLYLHVWVSMFGGRGDFSNTYWSPLQYLGYLKLY